MDGRPSEQKSEIPLESYQQVLVHLAGLLVGFDDVEKIERGHQYDQEEEDNYISDLMMTER